MKPLLQTVLLSLLLTKTTALTQAFEKPPQFSQLFTTSLTSTCNDLCLSNNYNFCSTPDRTSGNCYYKQQEISNDNNLSIVTDTVCSNDFLLPQIACPHNVAMCGKDFEVLLNESQEFYIEANGEELICAYKLVAQEQALINVKSQSLTVIQLLGQTGDSLIDVPMTITVDSQIVVAKGQSVNMLITQAPQHNKTSNVQTTSIPSAVIGFKSEPISQLGNQKIRIITLGDPSKAAMQANNGVMPVQEASVLKQICMNALAITVVSLMLLICAGICKAYCTCFKKYNDEAKLNQTIPIGASRNHELHLEQPTHSQTYSTKTVDQQSDSRKGFVLRGGSSEEGLGDKKQFQSVQKPKSPTSKTEGTMAKTYENQMSFGTQKNIPDQQNEHDYSCSSDRALLGASSGDQMLPSDAQIKLPPIGGDKYPVAQFSDEIIEMPIVRNQTEVSTSIKASEASTNAINMIPDSEVNQNTFVRRAGSTHIDPTTTNDTPNADFNQSQSNIEKETGLFSPEIRIDALDPKDPDVIETLKNAQADEQSAKFGSQGTSEIPSPDRVERNSKFTKNKTNVSSQSIKLIDNQEINQEISVEENGGVSSCPERSQNNEEQQVVVDLPAIDNKGGHTLDFEAEGTPKKSNNLCSINNQFIKDDQDNGPVEINISSKEPSELALDHDLSSDDVVDPKVQDMP